RRGRVARREGRASRARRSRESGPGAGERARRVPPSPVDRDDAGRGTGGRRADARFLPLDVRIDVDAGAVRNQAKPRVLLPDRRGAILAARAPAGTHAVVQLSDPLEHLDPRGLPRTLPALPAPAAGGIKGEEVDLLRARIGRRRVGALLRADDDRG